jgi:cobalt-zinc-cadmium efflux system membrane fusion protein
MRRTNFAILIMILPALLAMAACSSGKQPAPEAKAELAIQTTQAEARTVSSELAIPASVQPDPRSVVHVFSQISGRVVSLRFKPGDAVRSGETVAIIQSSDAASARSDFEKAKAQAQHSESALRRATLLYQHEAIAQRDLEDATAQAASDKSDLARARQRLHMLGLSEDRISDQVSVPAPRSGVVLETATAAGEFSKSLDASNSLLTIADLSSVWVVGSVYERDLAAVSVGMAVRITVDAYPGSEWTGKVANISDVVDPATHSIKLRVVVDNKGRKLKPDMFAAIHVLRPPTQVAVIPSSALLHEGNETFVIVQKSQDKDKKDKFEKRTVDVQESGPRETLVRSGVAPGEVVVSSGAELLRKEAGQ